VIVTDFNNYAMPFIRYNMGDICGVGRTACSCGRGLPLIREVQGRSSDFIKRRDGSLIHGEYFTHAFYGMEGVQKFQVVQESLELILVSVVAGTPIADASRDRIIGKIREALGEGVRIEVRQVADLPVTASGKFRFTLSKV
jgi:phenylacetate-CoA ligase